MGKVFQVEVIDGNAFIPLLGGALYSLEHDQFLVAGVFPPNRPINQLTESDLLKEALNKCFDA